MCKDLLLKPTEIINKYPEISNHWNSSELGYLFRLGLIKGKKTRRSSILSVNSIKKILKYKITQV